LRPDLRPELLNSDSALVTRTRTLVTL